MKKATDEVLFQAEATYKDLLLRKSLRLRVGETVVFIAGMLLVSPWFPTGSGAFKLFAVAMAIAVVGLAPFVYKAVLRPRYTLTTTHLIVSIGNKETAYPLHQVEQGIEGRNVYVLNGKREALMVSREFLERLNERLLLFHKKNKRR